jgi:hypothetical protein
MSNLMPEVHVNKNGVPVKKYVRADPKSGSGAASKLPMPSAGFGNTRTTTPRLGIELSRTTAAGFSIHDLDPAAAKEIESLLEYDAEQRTRLYHTVSAVRHAIDTLEGESRVTFLHNVAAFGSVMQGDNNTSFTSYINGLSAYPDSVLYPDIDYILDAPEEMLERAQCLIEFTLKAQRSSGDRLVYDSFIETWATSDPSGESTIFTKLHDSKLAAYVMDHPEQSDRILELMNGPEEMSVELMADRLNFSVQAMSEGLL